ncbi:MAG: nuclear transport factor 2 family protein, partial [Ilumatobacteraceae bacterium]
MNDHGADRLAIVDVTHDYCWALDTKSWDDLDDVFLPDATADLGWPLEGREAIKARIRSALEPLDDSQHLVA